MINRRTRSLLIANLIGVAMLVAGVPAMAQDAEDSVQLPAPEQEKFEQAAQTLDRLFAQLHKAENAEQAKAVEEGIWRLWAQSGSPTADTLLQQASRAMSASAYPVANRILDTLVEVKPDFAEAWNKRATLHYLERRFDQSLADIEVVLDLEPRHFGALAGLGMIRREKGDDKGALEAFRRALVIHPFQQGALRAVRELETDFEQKI